MKANSAFLLEGCVSSHYHKAAAKRPTWTGGLSKCTFTHPISDFFPNTAKARPAFFCRWLVHFDIPSPILPELYRRYYSLNQSNERKQPFFPDRPEQKNVPIRDDSLLHIFVFDPKKSARSVFLLDLPLPSVVSLFQHVKSSSEREPREMRGLPNQNDVWPGKMWGTGDRMHSVSIA